MKYRACGHVLIMSNVAVCVCTTIVIFSRANRKSKLISCMVATIYSMHSYAFVFERFEVLFQQSSMENEWSLQPL